MSDGVNVFCGFQRSRSESFSTLYVHAGGTAMCQGNARGSTHMCQRKSALLKHMSLYWRRGQATSSFNIPPRGGAKFTVGFVVAAFELTADACRVYFRAALGARVRVSASDQSIADAKLFATMTCNFHCAIFDCAFYVGLTIGTLVSQPGCCWCRAGLLALFQCVLLVLVLRQSPHASHLFRYIGARLITACVAAVCGAFAFVAVCTL